MRSGRAPGPSHLEAGDREQALAVADLDHVVVGVVEEELRAGTRGGAVSPRARDVRPPARVRTCCTLAGPSRMISLTYLMPQCLRRSSTSAIELHWNERWSARGSISAARRTGCPWMRCTPMPYPNSLFAPPPKMPAASAPARHRAGAGTGGDAPGALKVEARGPLHLEEPQDVAVEGGGRRHRAARVPAVSRGASVAPSLRVVPAAALLTCTRG